jgi:hypothetical protein
MKKITKVTINAIGKGCREVYLQNNPHGFSATNKVHVSKKSYNRRKEKYAKDSF